MTPSEYAERDEYSSRFTRWLLPAFLVSILLHIGLIYWARTMPIAHSDKELYEKIVPRTFHLDRVEIDPKLFEPAPDEKKQPAMIPDLVKLPDEKVSLGSVTGETKGPPAMPKLDQKILSDKPSVASTTFEQTLVTNQQAGAQSALEDPKSLQQALLSEKPESGIASVTNSLQPDMTTGQAVARTGPAAGHDVAGFSNLDALLAQTGPLTAETAPILMPTDLLFDYNEAQLKPEAMASLAKLAQLIRKNPQAVFQIEGHTDSFGPDDYNMTLSQQRAETVKAWLINSMNIPAAKVTAIGYGKTRLLSPATGTIEEQKLNRRVEIVIHTQ